jgi:hypothetical protein
MTEQELKPPEIDAGFQYVRGEGMTERISTLLIIRR